MRYPMFAVFSVIQILVFTHSNAGESFLQHYSIERDESGKVTEVRIASEALDISPMLLVNELKRDFEAFTRQELVNPEMVGLSKGPLNIAEQALKALRQVDLNTLFQDSRIQQVMDRFAEEMKPHAGLYRVLAKPEDAAYFYNLKLLHLAAKRAIELAGLLIDNVPALNTVTFIIERTVAHLEQRRTFHQNVILHALDTVPPEQLGLDGNTLSKIRSSIYESRIGSAQFWESIKARFRWNDYGNSRFESTQNACNKNLDRNRDRYDSVEDRHSFCFASVVEDGKQKIINLQKSKSMFSSAPSNAYDFVDPPRIDKARRVLRLIQLGLRFLPITVVIDLPIEAYIDSLYFKQIDSEGSLYGHSLLTGDASRQDVIARQSLNPWISVDVSTPEHRLTPQPRTEGRTPSSLNP